MPFLPPKFLKVKVATVVVESVWTEDDGTGFLDYPYRWTVTLQVTPQTHSHNGTRIPYAYDGEDIAVGDWMSNATGGNAWKIISIETADGGTVVCVVEDDQRFNTLCDPTQNGDGAPPQFIDGFVFSIYNGTPILMPMIEHVLTSQWPSDIVSRFRLMAPPSGPAITISIDDIVVDFSTDLPTISIDDIEVDLTNVVPDEPVEPAIFPSVLSTLGNQIVDADGAPIRLKSTNWHGLEGGDRKPAGVWMETVGWKDIIDRIAEAGFNCIRLPFSGSITNGTAKPGGYVNYPMNPEFYLEGSTEVDDGVPSQYITCLEVIDRIVEYCETKELYIVLDHHRRSAGDGADGWPVDGSYNQAAWINSLTVMADRYKDSKVVVGIDVHNEPHNQDHTAWRPLVTAAGNAVHAIAPDWLIFVEGCGNTDSWPAWWGSDLRWVADHPIVLTTANKVVYSPHEYGQSVGSQSWLATTGGTPANWPLNLYPHFHDTWGFIFEQDIAPLWIGEFGGFFGYNNSGVEQPGSYQQYLFERQWLAELVKYMNGDYNGNNQRDLSTGKQGISFAYWTFPPTSADTGGLLHDDFSTLQAGKLALLADLLPPTTP